ncbi:subtilisin-like serine protease [Ceratobasidium sp. 428]|nr:subtilisin-like serine protease [Ceratobasidium sp. 428]
MANEGGIPDSYIVILKETSDQGAHVFWVKSLEERYKDSNVLCKLLCEYEAVKGYAANLTEAALEAVARSPDVEQIVQDTVVTEDGEVEGSGGIEAKVIQCAYIHYVYDSKLIAAVDTMLPGAWTASAPGMIGTAKTTPNTLTITIVSTQKGRKLMSMSTPSELGEDNGPKLQASKGRRRGHGTLCAGIIAGKRWGACKEARVIAVKITEDGKGEGKYAAEGIDWVITQAAGTERLSVINASFSSPANPALDKLAKKAVAAGIHFCAAAGNGREDASHRSPARVAEVITVGATSIDDHKEPKSNFGSAVDIFAPGVHIYSAGIESPTDYYWATGTSLAAPHVAGVVAYRLYRKGEQTPEAIREWLIDESVENALHHIGEGSP